MAAGYGAGSRWMEAARAVLLFVALALALAAAAHAQTQTQTQIPTPTPTQSHARPVRLLLLGDSLSAGFGLPHDQGFEPQLAAALHAAGQDVRVVDGGVSGDTSAGGLARLDWAIGDGVDAAVVELGGNDGLRGIDPAATETNLTAILNTLRARHIPVLLAGMLAPPNLGRDYGARFRAVFETLGRRPGVLYDPFFLEGVALHPDLQQPDGIHPNAAGVRVIVQRVLPLVLKLLHEAAAASPA